MAWAASSTFGRTVDVEANRYDVGYDFISREGTAAASDVFCVETIAAQTVTPEAVCVLEA